MLEEKGKKNKINEQENGKHATCHLNNTAQMTKMS